MNTTGSPDPMGPNPALMSAMTTEHCTLQSARTSTIVQANGRSMLFLFSVSGATVALAWVAQLDRMGNTFLTFAPTVLPALLALGLTSYSRLADLAVHDAYYARVSGVFLGLLDSALAPVTTTVLAAGAIAVVGSAALLSIRSDVGAARVTPTVALLSPDGTLRCPSPRSVTARLTPGAAPRSLRQQQRTAIRQPQARPTADPEDLNSGPGPPGPAATHRRRRK